MQREYQYNYNNYLRVVNLNKDYRVNSVEVNGRVVGVLENEEFIPIKADFRNSYVEDPTTGIINIASPYGERSTRSTTLSKIIDFASKGYDEDLDLVRMGYRYMDSGAKRFITPDPLFMESPEKCVESPFECNLYSYAGGNPAMGIDPEGLDPILVGEGIGRHHQTDKISLGTMVNSINNNDKLYFKTSEMKRFYNGVKKLVKMNDPRINRLLKDIIEDKKDYTIEIDNNINTLGVTKYDKILINSQRIKDDKDFAAILIHELGHYSTDFIRYLGKRLSKIGNEVPSIIYENIVNKYFHRKITESIITRSDSGGFEVYKDSRIKKSVSAVNSDSSLKNPYSSINNYYFYWKKSKDYDMQWKSIKIGNSYTLLGITKE